MMRRRAKTALVATLLLGTAFPAAGQRLEDRPEPMRDVGVDQKLGASVPLGLRFRSSKGEWITLGDLINGDRPVMLTLNYSGCPMLCKVQLNGLVIGLKDVEWDAGDGYDVISVSLDPLETAKQAHATKMKYVKDYGRSGAAHGWHFLTGKEADIRALADAVGFRYKYVPSTQEYAHAASLIVCSPDGVITRYLNGIQFDPRTVELALVEAAEGKVGSFMDQFILTCYQWDETAGRYGPAARTMMSAGALVTVLALAAGLLPYWLRRNPPEPPSDSPAATPTALSFTDLSAATANTTKSAEN